MKVNHLINVVVGTGNSEVLCIGAGEKFPDWGNVEASKLNRVVNMVDLLFVQFILVQPVFVQS